MHTWNEVPSTQLTGGNLPTRDRRYVAVGHTTSGGPRKNGRLSWPSSAREIRWYDLHRESNPGRSHGSTMVYPLCYSRLNWIISVPKWELKWCSFHLRYKTFFFISCALNSIHHAGLLFISTTQTNFPTRKSESVFLNILNWEIMLHNSSPDFDIDRLS